MGPGPVLGRAREGQLTVAHEAEPQQRRVGIGRAELGREYDCEVGGPEVVASAQNRQPRLGGADCQEAERRAARQVVLGQRRGEGVAVDSERDGVQHGVFGRHQEDGLLDAVGQGHPEVQRRVGLREGEHVGVRRPGVPDDPQASFDDRNPEPPSAVARLRALRGPVGRLRRRPDADRLGTSGLGHDDGVAHPAAGGQTGIVRSQVEPCRQEHIVVLGRRLGRHRDQFAGLPVAQGQPAGGALDVRDREPQSVPVEDPRVDRLGPPGLRRLALVDPDRLLEPSLQPSRDVQDPCPPLLDAPC